ncbi:Uncharacterised protein [Shigella sonnei]|jgi:hypothetical protein|nr:Uncharacterised protein [Shigella sonnei]
MPGWKAATVAVRDELPQFHPLKHQSQSVFQNSTTDPPSALSVLTMAYVLQGSPLLPYAPFQQSFRYTPAFLREYPVAVW